MKKFVFMISLASSVMQAALFTEASYSAGGCGSAQVTGQSRADINDTCQFGSMWYPRDFNMQAHAEADYGMVAGRFSNTYTSGAIRPTVHVKAEFNDTIRVTGISQPVQLQYTVQYAGYIHIHPESYVGGGFHWIENGQQIGTLLDYDLASYPNPTYNSGVGPDGRATYTGTTLINPGGDVGFRGLLDLGGGDEYPTANIKATLVGLRAIAADGSVVPAVFSFRSIRIGMTSGTGNGTELLATLEANPVPEPMSMSLLGGGLALFYARRWRK